VKALPRIAVLFGGVSHERKVSIGSGQACAAALSQRFEVDAFDIVSHSRLPEGLEPERHVAFSTLHGTFGEDGGAQRLFEAAGLSFAGCDSASSALTFDKALAKRRVAEHGVPIAPDVVFEGGAKPEVGSLVRRLGSTLALKPLAQGSSVGLAFAQGEEEIAQALAKCSTGSWIAEPRIMGREFSVGVLQGEALEVVEIRPKSGRFDYQSKYTKGLTSYLCPAPIDSALRDGIRKVAVDAYLACGCRDFARIDCMVDSQQRIWFLEINTLPGMKETSLLPMSASACGYNFEDLLQKLVEPAILRYEQR